VGSSSPRPEPIYTNLARDAWERDLTGLFAAGEAVEALTGQEGWTHIVRLVEMQVADLDQKLDGRLLDSRSEYARLHGQRSALRGFMEAAHAIVAEAARKRVEQERKHERVAESTLGA
jgi:hypothetical protein